MPDRPAPLGWFFCSIRRALPPPSGIRMKMRYVVTVLALLAIIGGLAGVKFQQISMLIGAGKRAEKMGAPPEAVGTTPTKADTWGDALTAVGSIAAARGVTLSNDAPGIVSGIHFESGQGVPARHIPVALATHTARPHLPPAAALPPP